MRILEHFDRVIVLADGSDAAPALCARLLAANCVPDVVDLSAPEGWRAGFAPLLAQPRSIRATGVLLLSPAPGNDGELWRSQDRMVERLENQRWELAYLGHRDGAAQAPEGLNPGFIECDAVPDGVSAIALPWRMLDAVIGLMPDCTVDGPLSPADWLTMFSWLAQPLLRSSRALFAWPPLLSPDDSPEPAGIR
jgi:hypothetical protein